jgi:aspartyl/asparaginyl beta-hydroxylase (cupin superfamily)
MYLLILTLLIIYLIFIENKQKHKNPNKCLININNYPELIDIQNNKTTILNDLINVLNNKWSTYDDYHNKRIFDSNSNDIIEKLKNTEKYLNSTNTPEWKLYGLILNGKPITDKCQNTINLLLKNKLIINAGFSCLEPGKITDVHSDNNINWYRYQLPLIIPEGDCKFKLQKDNSFEILDWSKPFIFDDCCLHQVWNNTNKNRYVLIIDIKRNS